MFKLAQGVAVLLRPEEAVELAALQEFAMPGNVDRTALIQNQDGVGSYQGGKPMRDNDHGATLCDPSQVGIDDRLALGIERTGGLVEDQELGVDQERAGDRDPLTLSAGEIGRALLDERIVAARQALDEFLGTRH